jgi:hypothetical protein
LQWERERRILRLDNVMENQETSPSGINVLIIHNDKKLFRLVKDYLETMGYDVDVTYTGIRTSHYSHKQFLLKNECFFDVVNY